MRKCWCGNKELKDYSEDYLMCDICHTLVTKKNISEDIYNVNSEDEDKYGKNYWEEKMAAVFGVQTISEIIDIYLRERTLYWVKYLLKYIVPPMSVAEIGCGIGAFSYLLAQMGYETEAFDLSPELCKYVEKTLNIDIKSTGIEKLDKEYDAVVAFDLVEHIVNPNQFFETISNHLTEDGIICIQTPVYDEHLSYSEMLVHKPRFREQLKSDEHVFIYSKNSIVALLNKYGFEYVGFENAFFGNEYDMFLFASRKPFVYRDSAAIEAVLNSIPIGRIVKALITLHDELLSAKGEVDWCNVDRANKEARIGQLVQECDHIRLQNEGLKSDHELLLKDYESLEVQNAKLNGQIEKDKSAYDELEKRYNETLLEKDSLQDELRNIKQSKIWRIVKHLVNTNQKSQDEA